MATIRQRTEADIDVCISILSRVYEKDAYPVSGMEQARDFITGSATLQAWVAEQAGRVIGHSELSVPCENDQTAGLWWQQHPNERVALFGRLFVDPDACGGGTAQKLVDTAATYGREKELHVLLIVLIKDQSAIRLYDRLGWERFASTVFRYGEGEKMDAYCYAAPRCQP